MAHEPFAVPNSRCHVLPLRRRCEIVTEYGLAARPLTKVGCGIVASHGCFPAQILTPAVNLRTDDNGGSVTNRLRFLRAVAAYIRAKTAPGSR